MPELPPEGRRGLPRRADRPVLLGVVNVTPDSFSDGGRYLDAERAVAHGLRLVAEGADALDVGGESTRPGSAPVPPEEQVRRVVPVIAALVAAGVVVSVDTTSAVVAEAALGVGAGVINDVSGLSDPALAALAAEAGAELVVMHTRGTPETMQHDTVYADLEGEVEGFLRERARLAMGAGVPAERVILDPGLGFAKAWRDNPRLVRAVPRWRALGHRVLIGGSRKAFVGHLSGVSEASERVEGSVGVALAAAAAGAEILRVHDVAATARALATFLACLPPGGRAE